MVILNFEVFLEVFLLWKHSFISTPDLPPFGNETQLFMKMHVVFVCGEDSILNGNSTHPSIHELYILQQSTS